MKRVIIFIGLKVLEIGGVIFGPYYLGKLSVSWTWYYNLMDFGDLPYWLVGFTSFCLLVAISIALLCIMAILMANWEWAKKIAKD